MTRKSGRQRFAALAAILAGGFSATNKLAFAANTDNWIAGSSDWDTASNWNTDLVPGAGDTVNIGISNTTSFVTTYDYTGPVATLSSLNLSANTTNGAIATMSMSAGTLMVESERVGDSNGKTGGIGTFNQSGGDNTLEGALYLGLAPSDAGFYNLSGTGSVQFSEASVDEYIGYYGAGVFNQSGGYNASLTGAGGLYVGYNTGSTGSYTLSGGPLLVETSEYVGFGGLGIFDQTGGAVTVGGLGTALYMGNNSGSTGIYTLSGTGILLSDENENVGQNGLGTFMQSGGTNNIIGGYNLILGVNKGSTGNYTLTATSVLSVTGSEYIGFGGAGTFNQSGGANTASQLVLSGTFGGTRGSAGTGTYTLTGGSLSPDFEYVGLGAIGVFSQSGGTNTSYGLDLGGDLGSTGTYTLSNAGSLAVTGYESIGPSGGGMFDQSGGTNTINDGFGLLVGTHGLGKYTLSGNGALSVTGDEDVGAGILGTGTFTQSGGINTIAGAYYLSLGTSTASTGTYALSGGTLAVSGNLYVGGSDAGPGGTGNLTISNTGQMTVTGTLQVYALGDVNISGTVPTIGGLTIASGGLVNVSSALLITSDGGNPVAIEAAIRRYIKGGEVISGFANANPAYGIAYADGSDAGATNPNLKPGELVIEPALLGDADLNGTVNFHDLQDLLTGFGGPGFWDQGNFNNHATVDFNDLQLLLGNFGDSTTLSDSEMNGIENLVGEFGEIATPNANGVGFTLTSVPEPTAITLLAAGALGLLTRRRRCVL